MLWCINSLFAAATAAAVFGCKSVLQCTGCDNVSKVGTKKELLHILNSFDPLITGFGRDALDYDMLQQAD